MSGEKQGEQFPRLTTWHDLCHEVTVATEERCFELLKEEMDGPKRLRHVMRIYSRINRLRAARERKELTEKAKSK